MRFQCEKKYDMAKTSLSEEQDWEVRLTEELLSIRDGRMEAFLTHMEVKQFLDEICMFQIILQ